MKHWKTICALGLASILWAGCAQETALPPVDKTQAAKPAELSAIPVNGYRKKVFAIGHPFVAGPSTEWELYEEFTYDSAGRETDYLSHFDGKRSHVVTQYDAQGHVLLATHTNNQNADRLEFRSTWNADHTTQAIEEYSQVDGRVVSKSLRTFDAQGNLLRQEDEDLHLPDFNLKTRLTYVYNDAHQLIEQREAYKDREIVGLRNTYDAAGNCIQIERFDAEGKPSQIETFTYDGQGHKTSAYLQDLSAYNANKQLKSRCEYDAKGNLIKEVRYEGQCDTEGEKTGKCLIAETITNTYDAQGRILTEERERAHGEPTVLRKRFEYETYAPAGK